MKQISALRGLAIILIVLFHLAPQGVPYGYFGVEVFLVISGFLLMYSLQRQQMQFNLPEFAQKKILRLFMPATAAVILIVLLGLFCLDCSEISRACKAGRYTLLGNANAYLGRVQANYFAPDSSTNPFLHMWYLAVIIHVYFLFALASLLSRYLPHRVMLVLLWSVGIGSLLWAYSYPLHELMQKWGLPVWEQVRPVSHYMTMPRLWEPLAGAWLASLMWGAPSRRMLAVGARPAMNAFFFVLGLTCVLWPALSHGATAAHGAAVVVLGTCLVIRFGDGGVWTRLLNNGFLLWVGGISFSLYLVHMPLIAYFHSWFLRAPEWPEMLLIGVISLLVAWLFFICIEKRSACWKVLLPTYVLGLLLCVAGDKSDGFLNYINKEVEKVVLPQYHEAAELCSDELYRGYDKEAMPACMANFAPFIHMHDFKGNNQSCLLQMGTASHEPSLVLLGDSHAAASYPGVDAACKRMGISGVCMTTLIFPFWNWECPPLEDCKEYFCNRRKVMAVLAWLREHPEIKHIVIAQYWRSRYVKPRIDWDLQPIEPTSETYTNSLRRFVEELRALGKEVVLVAPSLCVKQKDVTQFVRGMLMGKPVGGMQSICCSREEYSEQTREVMPIINQLEAEGLCTVWRTMEYIPADRPFCAYEDEKILYRDADHMSSEGAIRLFRWLQPQMEKTLKPAGL